MMSSLLQHLENNEAVLLMYLAGELPDADRAEVEEMLKGDPALRMELAELAAMQDHMTAVLKHDDSTQIFSRREAAVREVAKAINTAKIEALRKPQPVAQSKRTTSRIPVWAYPVAAAAILVIGIMVFSGKHQPVQVATGDGQDTHTIDVPEGPAPIIPAVASDDSLSRLEKEFLSIRSSASEIDLFGGSADLDH